VGAELFHADRRKDGRTDGQAERWTNMTKQIVALRNCAKTPNQRRTSMSLGESEHAISEIHWPQIYALGGAATETGTTTNFGS
jgi:hypothetical protein